MKSRDSFRDAIRLLISPDSPGRVLTAAIDQGSVHFEVVADDPRPGSSLWSWSHLFYGEDDSFGDLTGDVEADVETIELVYFDSVMSQVSDHYLELSRTSNDAAAVATTSPSSPVPSVEESSSPAEVNHFHVLRDFILAPYDPDRWQTVDGYEDPEVNNAAKALSAADPLKLFVGTRHADPDDDGEPIVHLITNLLHLAHSKGFDTMTIVECALLNFEMEAGVLPSAPSSNAEQVEPA